MEILKPIKEGKEREIYDNGDSLIMVATDRISCFDVILNNEVTKKGTVLTQMSKFWFDMTEDIVPNHMISVDVKDMPEFFQQEKFEGKSMMCRKLDMLPIECIVRGYITGSGWASYQKNGTVCGISLPEGLKETVFMFKALNDIGWKGVVEYDCHMLRAEGDPGDPLECRRQFIRDCAEALEIALALAARIRTPEPGISHAASDLASIRQMCGL